MPVELPPNRWAFPSARSAGADGLVAFGADLAPATLIAAYRVGLFPMPAGSELGWWSPDPRGVIPLDGLRVSRSLARATRRFEIRVDTAFEAVVAGCADPSRTGGWIDNRVRRAYHQLHRLGWAHSVEAWDDDGLAGGLYGVAVGGLFSGESMFHRRRDASKVALVGLVDRLRSAPHATERLLDVQWVTPHLASLGAVPISRERYLARLTVAGSLPDAWG